MADAPANQAQLSGSLPLYKDPQPLSPNEHKGTGVKYASEPFGFLREAHFVPLTIGEFGPAGSRFPVIFLGENKVPVAAMGLRQGQNLFVDDKGEFEDMAYLPAFVRRYPFVAAMHSQDKERFTVCVDAGSPLFSDNPDQPFFGEDGQPTEFTQRAIEFVRRYEADANATQQFVERMNALDLFEQQNANFQPRDQMGQPSGEPQVVATYHGISGEKLKALPAETLAELRDNAYLGAIYAHMMSLSQWDFVIQRAVRRQNVQGGDAGAPAGASSAPPPPPEQ